MNQLDKELLQKFFRNRCTHEETEQVYSWFETPDGQEYLNQKTERDMHRYADDENLLLYPDVPSDQLFARIQRTKQQKRVKPGHNGWWVKAAVAVLMIGVLTGSYFLIQPATETAGTAIVQTRQITTGSDQHRLVTLNDGTQIRLNSNSSIEVPEQFPQDIRELTLTGEAWFSVSEDADRPFIVHANNLTVRVLGTEFNIKIDNHARNIQVAVAEGRVALNSSRGIDSEKMEAILSRNTFALYNTQNDEILIESTPITNYMSWMSGRLHFYDDPFWQVSRYIERLYNVQVQFDEQPLNYLTLSLDIAKDELTPVLDIIAQTLSLEYRYNENNRHVLWIQQTENPETSKPHE